MSDKIRVMIADDHAVVRQGLTTFLELQDDIVIVAQAADGEEAARAAARTKPDVALMDLVMPRGDGIQAIAQIAASSPATRLIVLTSFAYDDRYFSAIRSCPAG